MKLEVAKPAFRALTALLLASPLLAQDPYAPAGEAQPLPPVLDPEVDELTGPTSDQLPFYVSLGFGFSNLDVNESALGTQLSNNTGTAASVDSFDSTDSGVRLRAGYWVHPRIALELGFVDLGNVTSAISFAGAVGSEAAVEQGIRGLHPVMGRGITAGARGLLLDGVDFDVSAKAAAFFWEADNEFSVEFNGAALSFVDEQSGTDLTLGLGAHYALSPEWSLELELDSYRIGDEDALVISLGARYSFDL